MHVTRLMLIASGLAGPLAPAAWSQPPKPIQRPPAIKSPAPKAGAKAEPRGYQAFAKEFDPNAVGLNQINAYLLTYLAAAVFPENLARLGTDHSAAYIEHLHQDRKDFFGKEFAARLTYLFDSPRFHFISPPPNPDGYDPEAMIIDTPTAVFVVFRGTDRVATAKPGSFTYEWGEWLSTDFDPMLVDPGETIAGKVHKGMWFSLRLVRDDILSKVKEFNPKGTKKLWITGHSLGAAFTELFTAYAESKGVQVQGAYAIAAPHVGDQAFVTYLNGKVKRGQLQRFEFVDDPITLLAPYALGYQRAGVRNHYDDLSSFTYDAPERAITDDARVFPAIEQVATQQALHIPLQTLDGVCFHYPEWYLNASFNQVAQTERGALPSPRPFGLPDSSSAACDAMLIARAHFTDPGHIILDTGEQIARNSIHAINTAAADIHEVIADSAKKTGEAASEAADTISFNADNMLKNAVGTAVDEGTYYIRCLKGGKYLEVDSSCMGEDGCAIRLNDLGSSKTNNKFRILREAPYYRVEIADKVLDADADDLFDRTTPVQTWTRDMIPGANQNQKWLFYKVRANMYLIVSAANMKVLDADDKDVNKNGGHVKLYHGISNDATQVWLLEKAK